MRRFGARVRDIGKRALKTPVLIACLRNLRRGPADELELTPANARRLSWAWGNSYAASPAFLTKVAELAAATDGPILECGSGLTTVVAGHIAGRRAITLITLEHSKKWARRVRRYLRVAGAAHVEYRVADLRAHGAWDWYDPGPLPENIRLVICDGPPSGTRGGRYGLMPAVAESSAPALTILFDDYGRDGEREIVSRWEREFGVRVQSVHGSGDREFCVLEYHNE